MSGQRRPRKQRWTRRANDRLARTNRHRDDVEREGGSEDLDDRAWRDEPLEGGGAGA